MSTSALNTTATGSTNEACSKSPAPLPDDYLYFLSPGLYILNDDEYHLFTIDIAVLLAVLKLDGIFVPQYSPELEAEVSATMTAEQEKRFALLAQKVDIMNVMHDLMHLREDMEEIREVLHTEKEDAFMDFDVEDFKKMERELRR